MSFLGGLFGPVCEIDVLLNDAENRKTAELKTEDGKVEKHYLFYDGESVSGKVNLNVKQGGKRLEHQGIRIEFVGQIELFSDKSNTHEFVDLVKELALPGELTQNRSYDFEFMQVEKPYESYTGANVRLRELQHLLSTFSLMAAHSLQENFALASPVLLSQWRRTVRDIHYRDKCIHLLYQ